MQELEQIAKLRSAIEAEIVSHGGPERYFNNLHLQLPDRPGELEEGIFSSVVTRRLKKYNLLDLKRHFEGQPVPSFDSEAHAHETVRTYFLTLGQVLDELGIKDALINATSDLERQRIAKPLYIELRLRGYTHHDITG